jgi:hypothetical protein
MLKPNFTLSFYLDNFIDLAFKAVNIAGSNNLNLTNLLIKKGFIVAYVENNKYLYKLSFLNSKIDHSIHTHSEYNFYPCEIILKEYDLLPSIIIQKNTSPNFLSKLFLTNLQLLKGKVTNSNNLIKFNNDFIATSLYENFEFYYNTKFTEKDWKILLSAVLSP